MGILSDVDIQKFINDNAFEYSDLPALQQTLEDVSGQDLDSFFNQWFERPGYAKLSLATTVGQGENGQLVTLSVAQAGLAWAFPLKVTLFTSEGPVEQTVQLEATSAQSFDFQVNGTLSRIMIHEIG